jgi:CheY-like chemotaxis protein
MIAARDVRRYKPCCQNSELPLLDCSKLWAETGSGDGKEIAFPREGTLHTTAYESDVRTPPPAKGRDAFGQDPHTRPRVLVVDDNPDALTILRLFLEGHGFQVITVESVRSAWMRIQGGLPDLIITDYTMPDLTGVDLCRRLRADQRTRNIPIVMHTGTDLPPAADGLYDCLLEKPTDLNRLAQRIRGMLKAATRDPVNAKRMANDEAHEFSSVVPVLSKA